MTAYSSLHLDMCLNRDLMHEFEIVPCYLRSSALSWSFSTKSMSRTCPYWLNWRSGISLFCLVQCPTNFSQLQINNFIFFFSARGSQNLTFLQRLLDSVNSNIIPAFLHHRNAHQSWENLGKEMEKSWIKQDKAN